MKELNTIVEHLTEFAREHKLVERALIACSEFLDNEAKENASPRDLSKNEMQKRFRSHALTFESGLLSYPYISTMLDLYVEGEEVGWYKLIVDLKGQAVDDYLVFYPEHEGGEGA